MNNKETTFTNNDYYAIRSSIRSLYDNDARSNTDICSLIFELRDKNKCIESISIALSDYNIYVEFSEGTTIDKMMKLGDRIIDILKDFILDNIEEIDYSDKAKAKMYINNNLFCDMSPVGNTLSFCL